MPLGKLNTLYNVYIVQTIHNQAKLKLLNHFPSRSYETLSQLSGFFGHKAWLFKWKLSFVVLFTVYQTAFNFKSSFTDEMLRCEWEPLGHTQVAVGVFFNLCGRNEWNPNCEHLTVSFPLVCLYEIKLEAFVEVKPSWLFRKESYLKRILPLWNN